MSYEIGCEHDGGFEYRVDINGISMTGWRRGNRKEVEEYVRAADNHCQLRANGRVVKLGPDGRPARSYRLQPSRYRPPIDEGES